MKKPAQSLWTSLRATLSSDDTVLETLSDPSHMPAAWLVRGRSFLSNVLVIALTLAAASGVRLVFVTFTLMPSGSAPFAFYFPAVMIVTIIAGWQSGVASILLGIAIALFLVMPPVLTWHLPDQTQGVNISIFAAAAGMQVLLAQGFRAALQRINASEARYRMLVRVTTGIVWHTDADGRVQRQQAGWTELTGMTWPDYGGHGWLKAIHEEDLPKLRPDAERLDAQGFHEAEFRLRDARSGDWRWYGSRAIPIADPTGRVREWMTTMNDIHEPRLAHERRELLMGEARHRLKNLVTIIESLAQSSRIRGDAAIDMFLKKFLGRLHALSAVSDLTLAGNYGGMQTSDVMRETLRPFMEDDGVRRFHFDGPSLLLSEQTGGSLALGIHELATNAIKYGALSVPNGEVFISWRIEKIAGGEQVTIEWKERGGPPPTIPDREGYGMRVVKFISSREKAGSTEIDFQPDGILCRVTFQRDAAT